jgi:plasmid maintenance system antidote protein VapI
MSQDPLLNQLADRVRSFSAGTGVSLNRIAKLIETDTSNFSAFVNGRAGLSATSVCRLLELLNFSKRQLEIKLNAKPIQIRHAQKEGAPMRFDAGWWIPAEDSTDDPVNSTSIDNTVAPSGDDITDTLRQVDDYHRQAREAIAAWFANAQKGTVNRSGDQRNAGSPSRFNR